MSKNYLRPLALAAVLAGMIPASQAAVLTPGEALSRLKGDGASTVMKAAALQTPRLVATIDAQADGQPAVYAFNKANGYVILSADDCAPAMLGYADKGAIDPDNMPDGLRYMLECYARQIAYARENGLKAPTMVTSDGDTDSWGRTPIAPYCKTTWDQKAPYYDLSPAWTFAGVTGVTQYVYCYTGCQATSIAQVMKYFEWPKTHGNDSVSYSTDGFYGYTFDVAFDFETNDFDWDNMLDSYSGSYTEEQGNAVAVLMAGCGAAVEMLYSPYMSATYANYTPYGLYHYMGYNKGCSLIMRDYYYPSSGWDQMVYDQLAEYGPVLYSGQSSSGGHAFICDGYSSEGYFHFNWGWSGTSDGYYMLSALHPSNQGTGGSGSSYNDEQDIIAYLNPLTGPDDCPRPAITGYNTGSTSYYNDFIFEADSYAEGSTVTVKGVAADQDRLSWSFKVGVMFDGPDGEQIILELSDPQMTLSAWQYENFEGTVTMPALTTGKWTVRPCFLLDDTDVWQLMRWPLSNTGIYWLRVGEDGSIVCDTVETHLEVTSFLWNEDHSPADNYTYASYTFELSSPDEAFSGPVYGILYREGLTVALASAESQVSIAAGETVSISQSMTYSRMVNGRNYSIFICSDASGNDVIAGPFTYTAGDGPQNSLSTVSIAPSAGAATEYFNLQGVRLNAAPASGIWLEKQAGETRKVVK